MKTNTIALSYLMIIFGEFKNLYIPSFYFLKDVTRMFIVVWLFPMVFLEETINDKRHFQDGHSTALQNQESKECILSLQISHLLNGRMQGSQVGTQSIG